MNPWLYVWHPIVHVMGVDQGLPYGTWNWYNFWSGIAGSFVVAVVASTFVWYKAYSCRRAWWCFRHGQYEMAGGMYKVCYKHHPDHGKKHTWEMKLRHHESWKEAVS